MPDFPDPNPGPLQPLAYSNRATEARWVILGKFSSLEAQLAQAKLQSEGIPCNLLDQNAASVYTGVLGISVRLEVLEDDLERARAILEEVRSARAARAKDAEDEPYLDEDWRCSKCRSRDVSYISLSPPMLALSLLLMGLPLMFIKRSKRCADCGHLWRE